MKFVFSYQYFANCPVHGGGEYKGLKIIKGEEKFLNYLMDNLNVFHAMDVLIISSSGNIIDDVEIVYECETHRFNGIKYYVDGTLTYKTIDNGSGKLVWEII